MTIPPTIEWTGRTVRLIDQRRLPGELVFLECRTVGELCEAIVTLAIRGAPALGAAGAMGIALAAANEEPLEEAALALKGTRPTAVNLAWGVDRALAAADPAAEAVRIAAEDVERNRRLTVRSCSRRARGCSRTATLARSPAWATARRWV